MGEIKELTTGFAEVGGPITGRGMNRGSDREIKQAVVRQRKKDAKRQHLAETQRFQQQRIQQGLAAAERLKAQRAQHVETIKSSVFRAEVSPADLARIEAAEFKRAQRAAKRAAHR